MVRGRLGAAAARFLRTFRRRFRIPIDYRQYVVDSMRFKTSRRPNVASERH
jgi:hypothetical protein